MSGHNPAGSRGAVGSRVAGGRVGRLADVIAVHGDMGVMLGDGADRLRLEPLLLVRLRVCSERLDQSAVIVEEP